MYTALFECVILCAWEHSNKLIWSIYLDLRWLILVKCMHFPHFPFYTINWKKHNLKHSVKIAIRMAGYVFFFHGAVPLNCDTQKYMNTSPTTWICITYNLNNIQLSKRPYCVAMSVFMCKGRKKWIPLEIKGDVLPCLPVASAMGTAGSGWRGEMERKPLSSHKGWAGHGGENRKWEKCSFVGHMAFLILIIVLQSHWCGASYKATFPEG